MSASKQPVTPVLLAAGTTVDRRVLQARKGSVLVLVVGVLALMGIIVLVYATVGQGDRRSAAALVETRKLEDQSQAIGNYLASVVADSAVSTVTQRVIAEDRPELNNPSRQIERYVDRVYRRTWTMPGVDPEVRSTLLDPARPANEQPWRVFTPTGAIVGAWPIDQNLLGGNPGGTPPSLGVFTDPRIGLDPWLASTEMSWINLEGAILDTTGNGPWGDRHLDKLDWRSISNFAPDGRAVNLALLRGNFNLTPGVSPTRPAVTQPLTFRSSDYLTVERFVGSNQSRAAKLDPRNWEASQNLPTGDPAQAGEPISFNATNYWFRPADFFTNQVGVHRVGPDRRYPAGDVRNADNQWADADGDGVPDARWTELVDASDPNILRSVLPTSSNVRFFVAARAVDLSGLINLNTALSFDQPPTRSAAAGATPADIDLRRLLRFGHVYTDGAAGSLTLPGYNAYPQPAVVTSAENYLTYNRDRADEIGSSAFGALLLTRINGFALGPGAFTPQAGYVTELSQPLLGTTQRLVAAARKDLYNAIGRNPLGGSLTPDFSVTGPGNTAANRVTFASPFGIADELDLRTFQGLNDDSAVSRLEMTLDARNQSNSAFGPLRSNRSAEIERGASRESDDALLQAATSVRGLVTTVSAQRPLTTNIATPLASVRTATLTAEQRPERQIRQITGTPPTMSAAEVRPDLNTLLNTMAPEADDDDRNLAAFSLFQGIVGGLAPDLGIRSSLNSAFSLSDSSTWSWSWNPQARRLQVLHYGSRTPRLPGESAAGDAGVDSSFLGNSAEFALRTSAHLFANLVDGRDLSDRPSRVTVLLSEPFRSLGRSRNFDFNNDGVPDFEAWADANPVRQNGQVITQIPDVREATAPSQPRLSTVVDVGDEKLLPDPQWSPRTPPAINVYGVKPQPFLTAAVTFTLYADDPNNSQGGERQVKINGTISEGNSDFLCQVVAFQLHNPFDRPIALSQPAAAPGAATNREFGDATPVEGSSIGLGANNALSDLTYYIEFAGKFYALVEERRSGAGGGSSGYEARRLVLDAGETRWFYVTAQDPEEIVERWRRLNPSVGTQDDQANTGPFTDFINQQLSMTPVTLNPSAGTFRTRTPARLMRIQPVSMQRYPGTGIAGLSTDQLAPAENVPENQYFALFGGQNSAWINSDTEQPGPTNRAVRLWRVNQAQGERLSGVANSVNVLTNDMLVDALRDPAAPPAARRGGPAGGRRGRQRRGAAHLAESAAGERRDRG